jgi:hypothetical protein
LAMTSSHDVIKVLMEICIAPNRSNADIRMG